ALAVVWTGALRAFLNRADLLIRVGQVSVNAVVSGAGPWPGRRPLRACLLIEVGQREKCLRRPPPALSTAELIEQIIARIDVLVLAQRAVGIEAVCEQTTGRVIHGHQRKRGSCGFCGRSSLGERPLLRRRIGALARDKRQLLAHRARPRGAQARTGL